MQQLSGGAHQKSNKSKRQKDKMNMKKELKLLRHYNVNLNSFFVIRF